MSKLVKESLNDKLKGPSKENILNNLHKIHPNKALLTSAEIDLLKGVKLAIEKYNADVNVLDNLSLKYACKNGNLDMVKYLIQQGANINNGDALVAAASNNYVEIVKYLVENGANPHVLADMPFYAAAKNGHLDVIKYLTKYEIEENSKSDALIGAIKKGHLNVIKYLIENEIEFNNYYIDIANELNRPQIAKYIKELKEKI